MSSVMLCADSTSIQYPECLGLEAEALVSQDWLRVFSGAAETRIKVLESQPDEIWVAGSDEVDAINLAAALKQDNKEQKVCLLAFQGNGSLLSRAQAAQIDEVWDKQTFIEHYRQEKAARCRIEPIEGLRKDRAAYASTAQKVERGYVLSVLGAGGGVGKSSVAVIAAYLAQSKGYRTALVDADLQFGDVQYLTGREDTLPIDEAVSTPARLDALESGGRHPAILSAPKHLERSEELAQKMPELIGRLRERFDVVVVNTSPTWADLHLHLLEAGSNALFLIDQRPSSIRSCKHALQLCARCGIATQPIVFALNRCSRQSLFSSIDVTCALKGAHVVELAEGGRDVEELLGTGAPLELIDSGNALCQSIARVLADLLPKQQGEAASIVAMPSRKRFRIGSRRKKAACL